MAMKQKIQIEAKYQKNLNLDLYQMTWDLTSQIPEGMVSTYGAIAKVLGDIRASRAVGIIEHLNPSPIVVPCHRVVYSHGGIGGYGAAEGPRKKFELLENEGIKVRNGKILNFEDVLFTDFKLSGPPPLELLRAEQKSMINEIKLENTKPLEKIKTIAGIDVSYKDNDGFGVAVVMDINNLQIKEIVTTYSKVRFPYIPTYLSYHELPIALKLIKKLDIIPDVIIFDGNGVLHPHSLGLATHGGIILKIPTIGIAKKLLCGELKESNITDNLELDVILNGRVVGYGLRSKKGIKPVFVSPGNEMSLSTSLSIAKKIIKSRVPEPIRQAHKLALGLRRNKLKK